MIKAEVERLQRELETLAGATGVEGIRAATRLREDMQRTLQRSRALMAADLYYLQGTSLGDIAWMISEGDATVTKPGVAKWIKQQIGQDPLIYVGAWRDRDGFHVDSFPAESPEQIRKVMEAGVRLAPATWELQRSDVDAEDLWRRLTRLEEGR